MRASTRSEADLCPLKTLWTVWKASLVPIGTDSGSGEDAHPAELRAPAPPELLSGRLLELLEAFEQGGLEQAGGLVVIVLGAAGRLRHDPVDHAELEAMEGVRLEGRSGLLRLTG